MKHINNYIHEKLHISTELKAVKHPKDKEDLKKLVLDAIQDQGPGADLNFIDVSNITDLSWLFAGIEDLGEVDVSRWDVSKCENMEGMFSRCNIENIDLSKWNVGNVQDFGQMFDGCRFFNSDITNWDVSSAIWVNAMFAGCKSFNQDIRKWNTEKLEDAHFMFQNAISFSYDLSCWKHDKISNMNNMFTDAYTIVHNKLLPDWFK